VRRLLIAFLLIVALVALAAGCGGKGKATASSTGTEALPAKGSVKFPTPEQKAAKQAEARAKGISPGAGAGPAVNAPGQPNASGGAPAPPASKDEGH
jgi:hypothetical protein